MATPASDPRQIRLGIIGTGLAVEKLHWPALRQMPDRFRVTAFSNHTRPKAEHFASYSGTDMSLFVPDWEELLRRDDVDAVLISLPIPMNLPVTRAALAAGKDVICEKPAGKDAEEGRAFVELGREYPERTVLIAENWFYRDDLRVARSLIDEGAIGRIHLVHWRTVQQLIPREGEFSSTPWRHDPGYVGGPHLDAGVHHVAQIRLLCGDVAQVSAQTQDANATHGGPSDLVMALRFASGAAGSYTAAYPELKVPRDGDVPMRIYGTEGVLALGWREARLYRPDDSVETFRIENADGGYYNEFRNFHEALTGQAPVVATIDQSWRNMEVILAGLEAARSGSVVEIANWPDAPRADALPLWRPADGGGDLMGGLPASVRSERAPVG